MFALAYHPAAAATHFGVQRKCQRHIGRHQCRPRRGILVFHLDQRNVIRRGKLSS
jgi:hypothetical protein